MKSKFNLKIVLSVVIAFIFIQSMFFKFTGAPETIYIFSTLGKWSHMSWFGDYGAYLVGIVELIASILLFTRWHGIGALIALGTISGAIIFHLFTPLGIEMPVYGEAIRGAHGLMPTVGDLFSAMSSTDLPEKYIVHTDYEIYVPIELDGGQLFGMACLVWICALTLVVKQLKDPQSILSNMFTKKA